MSFFLKSLSVSFKEAYTRVFDGQGNWKKRTAAFAMMASSPFIALELDDAKQLSSERDAGWGDRQYAALQRDANNLAVTAAKLDAEYRKVYQLSQQRMTEPANSAIGMEFNALQRQYSRNQEELDFAVTDYGDRVLLSQGISEEDALHLLQTAETRTGYKIFPKSTTWQKELKFLDECQQRTIGEGLRHAGGPRATDVQSCQIEELYAYGGGRLVVFMGGFALAGIFLGAVSGFGVYVRNSLPEEQGRLYREKRNREELRAQARNNERESVKEIVIRVRQNGPKG